MRVYRAAKNKNRRFFAAGSVRGEETAGVKRVIQNEKRNGGYFGRSAPVAALLKSVGVKLKVYT